MFALVFIVGALVIAAGIGHIVLSLLAQAQIVGSVAAWAAGQLEPFLMPGPVANMMYGLVAVQIVVFCLSPVIWGPSLWRAPAARQDHRTSPRKAGRFGARER